MDKSDPWSIDDSTKIRIESASEAKKKHDYYKSCMPTYLMLLKNEINALKKTFPEVDFYTEGRLKSLNSISNKLYNKYYEGKPSAIYDILGVSYVIRNVNGKNDPKLLEDYCNQFMEFLCQKIPYSVEVPGRRKNYISDIEKKGYQALHSSRFHNVGNTPFFSEIQIRSEEMLEHMTSHDIYKPIKVSTSKQDIPDIFGFIYDEDGFCEDIFPLPIKSSFERFFHVPYPDDDDTEKVVNSK